MAESFNLSGHCILSEPSLLFNELKVDTHPLRGLVNYGPYSQLLGFPNQVRLAYFAPKEFIAKFDRLVSELNGETSPIEALNYYPIYPGFQDVFRIPLVAASDGLKVVASDSCLQLAQSSSGPELVSQILHSIGSLLRQKNSFDVLLLYLPKSWEKS